MQTLSSQFVTQGKKPILLHVITSTTHLNPAFKSNSDYVIYGHIGGVFNRQTWDITDHLQTRFGKTKFNVVDFSQ